MVGMYKYTKIDWSRVRLEQKINKGVDQTIYTFDIETSSGFIPPGGLQAFPFDAEKEPKYYRECQKVALCYEWQFGIGDRYYYGRELRDFLPILDKLESLPGKKIIWVHNLSFEQAFLLNLFFPDKIFAKKAHKVVYLEYGTITFRCSYMLTNMSLASWAKSIGAPEKLPDYDYEKIRTPLTPLDPFELEYGQRDIEIVRFGIEKMVKQYGCLQKIPLTQTGRIRREVNNLFNNDMSYRYKMARLLPRDFNEYARWRMAFSGGNTHANWYYAGIVMHGVSCCDIASSYPFAILTEKFPMSPFIKARHPERYIHNNKYCTLLEVRFTDLKAKMHIDYISYSKVYNIQQRYNEVTGKAEDDIIAENGKINYIKSGMMMITGIDYEIIREAYAGNIEIVQLWYSRAAYLDKRLREFVLDRYKDKTELKDLEGFEDQYAWGKQIINGIYGDFVSALVYDDTILNPDGTFSELFKSPMDIQEKIGELREKPWKLKSSYIWGVFVTAAARRNHFDILKVLDRKNHIVYYDTDSVYYIGKHDKDIEKYNRAKRRMIDQALAASGIDPERSRPKDKHGVVHQMGALEIEKRNLPEFKALRAKCYAYRDSAGGLHTTISGVSKKTGANALKGSLDNFTEDLSFSYSECGKKIPTYNVDQPECIWEDEEGRVYRSDYRFGLNLMPTQYNLSLGNVYYETLRQLGSLSCHFSDMTIDKLNDLQKRF